MPRLKSIQTPCDNCGADWSSLRKYRDGTTAYLCFRCGIERDKEIFRTQQAAYRKGKRMAEANSRTCQECGKVCGPHELDTHHKIPLSLGGTNDDDNLILLCEDCHKKIHYG